MNQVVAEKLRDFADDGIPEAFERDLPLGRVAPPARGNLATVVTGVRRCGKTYRLFQEMRRVVAEGLPARVDPLLQLRGRAAEGPTTRASPPRCSTRSTP